MPDNAKLLADLRACMEPNGYGGPHHTRCITFIERYGPALIELVERAAEVDALRAQLAEVEGERDGFRNGQAQVQAILDGMFDSNDKLAARLAEVEAREAASRAACESVAEAFAPDADFLTLADRVTAKLAASQAETRMLLEALADYGEHERSCILSDCRGGRPNKGGYEVDYGGKWYPASSPPKCECGLNDTLATTPGSDAALRELVMRAVCAGEDWAADSSAYHGCTTAEEAVRIRKNIVNAVLGPPATDASEGGGE